MVSMSDCVKSYSINIEPGMFCAGNFTNGGVDACQVIIFKKKSLKMCIEIVLVYITHRVILVVRWSAMENLTEWCRGAMGAL